MASTYSTLKIQLMATGENTGTWGTVTNTNLGTALEEAIVGSADVTFASADVDLTLSDTNSTQTARNLRLNLTGTSGGARNLYLSSGANIEKVYIINNGLADTVTVRNKIAGSPSGASIAIPAGKTMYVYNTGTNIVDAINNLSSLSTGNITAGNIALTTALPVSSGGTGANTLTAESVMIANGTSAVKFAAPGTAGNVLASTGSAWASTGGYATLTGVQNLSNKTLFATSELVTVSATAASGTINLDAMTSPILYYTSNASGNWTLNIRGNSTTALNTMMATNTSLTVVFLNTNGSTPYRQTALQIDNISVTPRWQGGSAPSSGNASSIDSYILTIIKTGSNTYTVFEAQTRFA